MRFVLFGKSPISINVVREDGITPEELEGCKVLYFSSRKEAKAEAKAILERARLSNKQFGF